MTSILLLLAGVIPTARAADVLYCVDSILGTDAMADALGATGHTVTTVSDLEGDCETEVGTGAYDLVVASMSNDTFVMPTLEAWALAGEPTILMDLRATGHGATYLTAFDLTPQSVNYTEISGFDGAINTGVAATITLDNPGWTVFSASVTSSALISLADSADGFPAILSDGDVYFNWFMPDTADAGSHADMVQLFTNQIANLVGTGLTDTDGDGFYAEVDDCDDGDGAVNPDAADTWYDGTDSDCGGNSDYDQDGDGDDDAGFGGGDCADTDASISSLTIETWYDGTDADCDGASDFDQDGDGEDYDLFGGDDCDDTDGTVNTSAVEVADGRDNNCDGTVDEAGPDSDGDGLSDADELAIGTDLDDPDTDGDGMEDGDEVGYGTNPFDRDTDDDGLSDGAEYNVYFCDPLIQDTDGDQIGDATEVGRDYATIHTAGSYFVPDTDTDTTTDPNDADTDDDGITDGNEDADRNGAVDATETDPVLWDTDADGLLDGTEIGLTSAQTPDTNTDDFIADADPTTTTDPLDADSDDGSVVDGTEDFNHDGAIDDAECDPNDGADDGDCVDDDFDGLSNVAEAGYGTDPLDADSDDDGISDGVEVFSSTDPLDNDTDNDGLSDGAEDVNRDGRVDASETDPRLDDTDGGGVNDGDEVSRGTDPLVADDDANDEPDPDPTPTEYAYVGGACNSAGGSSLLGATLLGLAVVTRRRK